MKDFFTILTKAGTKRVILTSQVQAFVPLPHSCEIELTSGLIVHARNRYNDKVTEDGLDLQPICSLLEMRGVIRSDRVSRERSAQS